MVALYPKVIVKPQDFSKVKKLTVPNQSMGLKEILQRFIRRESLPVAKDGYYHTGLGDLEKLSKEDMTVQYERVHDLREKIKSANARMKKQAEEKAAELKAAQTPPTPVSNTPGLDPHTPPGTTAPGSHTNKNG